MALKVPRSASLFKEGYQINEGVDEVVITNIKAVEELSKILSTSYGPEGLNKLIVNHLDQLYLSNDGNTILSNLEVIHPAAKLCLDAAVRQKSDYGDYSSFLLLLTSALMTRAKKLIWGGVVISEIESGYLASLQHIQDHLLEFVTAELDVEKNYFDTANVLLLSQILQSIVGAKLSNNQAFVTELMIKALKVSYSAALLKGLRWDIDTIRVIKCLGGTLGDSLVIPGLVFPRSSETKTKSVESKDGVKVAMFSCPLDLGQSETKGTVLLKSSSELADFSRLEQEHLLEPLHALADGGIKVIVTMGSVSDIIIEWADRKGILIMRLTSKFDFRRLAILLDATPLTRIGMPYPEELGSCDYVKQQEFGETITTSFVKSQAPMVTLLLRGATKAYLDLVERAIDDSAAGFNALLKDPKVVYGAGAFEMKINKLVTGFGKKQAGVQSLVVQSYADAFSDVVQALVSYYGKDSWAIVASFKAQCQESDNWGLELERDPPASNKSEDLKIFDILGSKMAALRLASNTAVTVLSVDQIIMAKRAGGPKPPQPKPDWDED